MNDVIDIENLICSNLLAAGSFSVVGRMASNDYRQSNAGRAVYVAFLQDSSLGIKSRLIVEETYQCIVVAKKGQQGTEANTAYYLTDSVRDLIHGKDWGEDDIEPFEYLGRELLEHDGDRIVFSVKFKTRHYLQVPTTT
jgi:hypothetical protein